MSDPQSTYNAKPAPLPDAIHVDLLALEERTAGVFIPTFLQRSPAECTATYLLATPDRLNAAAMRKALEDILKHVGLSGGTLSQLSTVAAIAEKGLTPLNTEKP